MLPSFLIIAALLAAPSLPSSVVTSKLSIPGCDFSDTFQFGNAECSLKFDNAGDRPIHLSNIRAGREGDSVSPPSLTIPAHGVAYVLAKVKTDYMSGHIVRQFSADTDEPGQPHRYAMARGFVASVLDEPEPTIDFGEVKLGAKMSERNIDLGSQEVEGFRITGIISAPSYLDVSIAEDEKKVRVHFKPDAPWGLHQKDRIELSINAAQQPRASILVKSDVRGDVVPADNPFALGLMRTGNENEFLIRLTSTSKKDFRTGAVNLERLKGSATVVPCVPASTGCKMVRLRIGEGQPTGQVGGIVNVELPDFKQTLPVYVWGMLLTPQTVVKNLDEETKKVEEATKSTTEAGGAVSPLNVSPAEIDIKQAIVERARDTDEQPAPAGNGPLVKWSVANEDQIHGYIVYRANSKSGPFLRVSTGLLPAGRDKGSGGTRYQWRDNAVESGKTYWYYVGMVFKDGKKQALTGHQEVVAK